MWRHVVAAAAAIGLTLVFLQFWGNFGGAMSTVVKVRMQKAGEAPVQQAAKAAMPISVLSAAPAACGKGAPCPSLPDAPAAQPHSKP